MKTARGRPRSFDVDEAVAVAQDLFHRRGYDAVGVAEIADALGIKPPSFYAAFGSKAGLFDRVLAHYCATADVVAASLDPELATAAAIERLLHRAADSYAADCGPSGCLVLEAARNASDPAIRVMTEKKRLASHQAIASFIARERPDRAEGIADYIGAVLAGLSASARSGMTPARLHAVAVRAVAAVHAELAGGQSS